MGNWFGGLLGGLLGIAIFASVAGSIIGKGANGLWNMGKGVAPRIKERTSSTWW